MSLVRWNPLLSTLSRWPSVWDDEMELTSTTSNNLDLYESENEVVVKANVAGLAEDKIDITFEKGVLWIKAEDQSEDVDKSKKYYSKSSWSYSYKIAVPGLIDLTKEPKAVIENGVVTVTFQKGEASKPKKLTVQRK